MAHCAQYLASSCNKGCCLGLQDLLRSETGQPIELEMGTSTSDLRGCSCLNTGLVVVRQQSKSVAQVLEEGHQKRMGRFVLVIRGSRYMENACPNRRETETEGDDDIAPNS